MTWLGFLGFEMPQQMPHFLEEYEILWKNFKHDYHAIQSPKDRFRFNIYFLFLTQIDQLLVQQKVELAEGNVVMFVLFFFY